MWTPLFGKKSICVFIHNMPEAKVICLSLQPCNWRHDPCCFLFWQSAVRTVRWWCSLIPTPPRMPSQIPPAHKTAATNLPLGKSVHYHQKVQPLWRMGSMHLRTQVHMDSNNGKYPGCSYLYHYIVSARCNQSIWQYAQNYLIVRKMKWSEVVSCLHVPH